MRSNLTDSANSSARMLKSAAAALTYPTWYRMEPQSRA
jgi:hypothetical protein